MSFLDSAYGDLKYENIGKWLDFYPPNPDGTVPRVKLRRAHSRHRGYQAALAAAASKLKGVRDRDVDDRAMADVYAKHLVLTWEHFICPEGLLDDFELKKGDRIPFSKANVLKLFDKRPRFFDEIHRRVHDEDFFGDDDVGDDSSDEESSKN